MVPEKRLPQRAFRSAARLILRELFRLTTRLTLRGLDHIPRSGAAIIVYNHVGHLDPLLITAFCPRAPEKIALADLLHVPSTGLALGAYGAILIHRDEYDRQVIRAALDALDHGGLLALAPEARMSPSAALERGREGAAYLALRSGAPVVPVGITGTHKAYAAWRTRNRPEIGMVAGAPFHISKEPGVRRRKVLDAGHAAIMQHIAELLPVEYRGYWSKPS